LLVCGSSLYVAGWVLRASWRAGHPAFDTQGFTELLVHGPMWAGDLVVLVAAAWALAARTANRAYGIVLGAAGMNLLAEGWHAWAHYHHQEYNLAHPLMGITSLLGVVAVGVVLFGKPLRHRREASR
jgi:hypothetical protein